MQKSKKIMELEQRYGAHNYAPLPVVLTKGKGCWVWDCNGRRYLDMLNAYSALSFGHGHPVLLKALTSQAKKIALTSRAFYSDKLGELLKELTHLTGFEKVLMMNTGAEAVETAIKAARKWGYQKKGIQENQAEIIVAQNNFHGRTTGIISFTSEPLYRAGFGPLMPGFKIIPFGSVNALKKAISPQTCAFLIEPRQGEAGIHIPPQGFLKEAASICKNENVLFILDEIQTGLGRTGKTFAYQHEIMRPDGLILGKALGGGLLPVSAFLANQEVMDVFTPGTHGSTFGGNPLGAAVALASLKLMKRLRLSENSRRLGKYFLDALRQMRTAEMTDIRGEGLWIGIDIDPDVISARAVCEKLLAEGLLCKETHGITVRLIPPLIISKKEIDWALQKIHKVFHAF